MFQLLTRFIYHTLNSKKIAKSGEEGGQGEREDKVREAVQSK